VVVYTIVIQCTEQRQYQARSCRSLHCQTAVVVYTIAIQRTEHRQYQTRSCHSLHCQTAMVVYTIVIKHTEHRQYQTSSCHSLHCQTAACDCAVSGSVSDGVMWHSPCTQWLTAAGSPLNFLNSPTLLHTTYHGAVPLNSHNLITSSADSFTSDRQFADTTRSTTSQQCWQYRLQ